MNTRKKGRITELLAKKELEDQGMTVYLVPQSRNYQKGQDVFGLWDVVAVKDKNYKYVQVKTNHAGKTRMLKAFAKEHSNENTSFELWVYYTRDKSWKKKNLN